MDSPFQSEALDISLDDQLCIRAPSTYLVRVVGDSMTRARIFNGDLLIVDKGPDAKQGQVVIGVVNQEPMVKRLDYVRGMPVLRSEAAGYNTGSSWKATSSPYGASSPTAYANTASSQ